MPAWDAPADCLVTPYVDHSPISLVAHLAVEYVLTWEES